MVRYIKRKKKKGRKNKYTLARSYHVFTWNPNSASSNGYALIRISSSWRSFSFSCKKCKRPARRSSVYKYVVESISTKNHHARACHNWAPYGWLFDLHQICYRTRKKMIFAEARGHWKRDNLLIDNIRIILWFHAILKREFRKMSYFG